MENLNWLLYTMYSRGDFGFCKNLIQKQLKDNFEHEYLHFIMVSLVLEDKKQIFVVLGYMPGYEFFENVRFGSDLF